MKRSYLGAALAFATAAVVLGSGACGGKVVLDGSGGNAGTGGSGQGGVSFSSTNGFGPSTDVASSGGDVTTTVGSGPSCGCDQVCAIVANCGFTNNQCQGICANLQPDQVNCVCSAGPKCGAILGCFGGPTGIADGGPGPGTGAGAGGGATQTCTDCGTSAAQSQCGMQLATCDNKPSCKAILDCHQTCGWSPQCAQQCDGTHPAGVADFTSLVDCAVCTHCAGQCMGTPVFDYCIINGG